MNRLALILLLIFCSVFFVEACKNPDETDGTDNTDIMDDAADFMDDSGMDGSTDGLDDGTDDGGTFADTIRFASYNVSMFGNTEGEIAQQLSFGTVPKFARIAEVIKIVAPDVLALMEFDYDETGESLNNFNNNYLAQGDNGIEYPYAYQVPSNTGLLSDTDIDGNGNISLPGDAYGFGTFNGQYAFALLSKYPIDIANLRSFQTFLWKDMPDALLPENADGSSYYSNEVMDVFRLSSKNHIDLPIEMPNGHTVHAILAHPTPPVFDGAEDRNGKRNHDEIRLLADYVVGANYLIDDNGQSGGLATGESFVIMGDLNADPYDGDSANDAILQLLDHPNINPAVCLGDMIASSNGGAEHNQSSGDTGDPSHDTSFFGLRIDYALPSNNLTVTNTGVFWPSSTEENHFLIEDEAASDHLLVWVDVVVE